MINQRVFLDDGIDPGNISTAVRDFKLALVRERLKAELLVAADLMRPNRPTQLDCI